MGGKRITTESFVERAKAIHGNKFGYEFAEYTNQGSQVTLVCGVHGQFSMRAGNHLNGKGCKQCALKANGENKRVAWVTLAALKKAMPKHIEITDVRTEFGPHHCLEFKCDVHGMRKGNAHSLLSERECPHCRRTAQCKERYVDMRATHQKALIKRLRVLYGVQYTYKKIEYRNATSHVVVTCKRHGDFKITPNQLTAGYRAASGVACKSCRNLTKTKRLGGRLFQYTGYELLGVKYLMAMGFHAKQITTLRDRIPKIEINYKKPDGHVMRTHYPDIYVKSANLIVEVKSPGTFGFRKFHSESTELIRIIQTKSRAAKARGFDYRVFLFTSADAVAPLELPEGWDTMHIGSLRKWWRNHSAD